MGCAYNCQLILFLFSENNSETEITLKNITQYFSEAAESYIKVFWMISGFYLFMLMLCISNNNISVVMIPGLNQY